MRLRVNLHLIWIQAVSHSNNIFTNFERHWSTFKIETGENFADHNLFGRIRVNVANHCYWRHERWCDKHDLRMPVSKWPDIVSVILTAASCKETMPATLSEIIELTLKVTKIPSNPVMVTTAIQLHQINILGHYLQGPLRNDQSDWGENCVLHIYYS